MCPNNLVGTVDLYIVSHHGIDASGSPALVYGLQPRVAIQQNGTRKGGTLQTNRTIYSSPGLEDHWQMHWSYNAGTEYNPAGIFIANIDEPAVIATVLTTPPGGGRGGAGGPPPASGGAPRPRPRSASGGCLSRCASAADGRQLFPRRLALRSRPRASHRLGGTGQPGMAPPSGATGRSSGRWARRPRPPPHRGGVHDQGVCSG